MASRWPTGATLRASTSSRCARSGATRSRRSTAARSCYGCPAAGPIACSRSSTSTRHSSVRRRALALNAFDIRFVSCAAPSETDLDTPLIADALLASGARVDVDDWRDATVDWANATLTMLRSPWDYVHHLDEFLEWAQRVNAVSDLWNPYELLRWNTHKSYLLDLQ